jgi:hypothetical protein
MPVPATILTQWPPRQSASESQAVPSAPAVTWQTPAAQIPEWHWSSPVQPDALSGSLHAPEMQVLGAKQVETQVVPSSLQT